MAALETKLRDVDQRETELVNLKLRGLVSDVSIERNAALLRAERTHLNDEMERQRAALATLEQSRAALDSLESLRDSIVDRLEGATPEDKRWVLQTLAARIVVHADRLEISVGIPAQPIDSTYEPSALKGQV